MPKYKLPGMSHEEAKKARKKIGDLGSAKVVEPTSKVYRHEIRSEAMDRSMRYPAGDPRHGVEVLRPKEVGEYLGTKYPRAAMRRAVREASNKPTGTLTPFTDLVYESASKTAKAIGKVRQKAQRRRRWGLFGLGLTAASLGSSIKEAQKK